MKKKVKKSKVRYVYYDWKEHGGNEFRAALKAFGLYVYASPMCEGPELYGYIISDKRLTRAEIKKYEVKYFEA